MAETDKVNFINMIDGAELSYEATDRGQYEILTVTPGYYPAIEMIFSHKGHLTDMRIVTSARGFK